MTEPPGHWPCRETNQKCTLSALDAKRVEYEAVLRNEKQVTAVEISTRHFFSSLFSLFFLFLCH